MNAPQQTRGESPEPAEPESFSAFGVRVLNQLSLSAWLPGAFFVACISMMLWFHKNERATLDGVGSYVEGNWIPILVLALPSLVLATLLTQAFSFEAIRTLEGYWRRPGPASWWMSFCLRHQLRRKNSLQIRFQDAQKKSFDQVRPTLIKRRLDGLVILAIEAGVVGAEPSPDISEERRTIAEEYKWWELSKPWDSAKMLRIDRDLEELPRDSRIMPTKLGNLLRSAEDNLENANGDIEGFVMRHRHLVPSRVLIHHDQFRTRLDMYCTLVFVSGMSVLASVPMLWNLPSLDRVFVPLILIITAFASYNAALASARGYRTVLKQIDELVGEARN